MLFTQSDIFRNAKVDRIKSQWNNELFSSKFAFDSFCAVVRATQEYLFLKKQHQQKETI